VGVLSIDLSAMFVLDPNGAVGRLQALGKVELDLARSPSEFAFNWRLRPLKPTMCKREADA
jgi:hypothetical protein